MTSSPWKTRKSPMALAKPRATTTAQRRRPRGADLSLSTGVTPSVRNPAIVDHVALLSSRLLAHASTQGEKGGRLRHCQLPARLGRIAALLVTYQPRAAFFECSGAPYQEMRSGCRPAKTILDAQGHFVLTLLSVLTWPLTASIRYSPCLGIECLSQIALTRRRAIPNGSELKGRHYASTKKKNSENKRNSRSDHPR